MLNVFKNINAFVFDIDGVLTDGTLLVLNDGLMARKMHVKDGYALQLSVKRAYKIFVISGGNSPQVKERLAKLGISNVYMPVENKLEKLKALMADFNLKAGRNFIHGR